MKKILLTFALTLAATSACAESLFGIDFDKPINKQYANDPFTTWIEGGIKVAGPGRGIRYIEIGVAGFDENGDTFASGEFYLVSNAMPDESNCHKVSSILKEQIPTGFTLKKYYGVDDFGCTKRMDDSWHFAIGGDITRR